MNKSLIDCNITFSGKLPKKLEDINSCQDAFCFKDKFIAIADGATRSFYPKIWAELLVAHFCENPNISRDNWRDWLEPVQKKWYEKITEKVNRAVLEKSSIWVTNKNRLNKFESAAATLIGIKKICKESNYLEIEAVIIGDSCLFIVIDDIVKSYLIESVNDFDDFPDFFASYNKDNKKEPSFLNIREKYTQKAFIIMATDALSEWILQGGNIQERVMQLLAMSSQDDFAAFVNKERENNRLKNDDTTLVVLDCSDDLKTDKILLQKDHESSLTARDILKDSLIIETGTKENVASENLAENKQNKTYIRIFLALGILLLLTKISSSLFYTDITNDEPIITVDHNPQIYQSEILSEEFEEGPEVDISELYQKGILPPNKSVYFQFAPKQYEIVLITENYTDIDILKEEENKVYFKKTLYIYADKAREIDGNRINITKGNNLRTEPKFTKGNEKVVFGKLKQNINLVSNFKKHDYHSIDFLGYFKK